VYRFRGGIAIGGTTLRRSGVRAPKVRGGADGEGVSPICANLTCGYTYPTSVLVRFKHLAGPLSIALCKFFCYLIPAFETFAQRQNRIHCTSEQVKCKRRLSPPIRLFRIFLTDVRTKALLRLMYARFFLIPACRLGFFRLVRAGGIPRGKKAALFRQLQL
jgi:hypothetical protein